jgi:iron complex outermembrane receptor protein
VRVVLHAGTVTYHALSLTRDFKASGLKATLGVANLLNQKPPQVTTLNLGELDTQGNSAFYTQYDWLGRRYFLNVKKSF